MDSIFWKVYFVILRSGSLKIGFKIEWGKKQQVMKP